MHQTVTQPTSTTSARAGLQAKRRHLLGRHILQTLQVGTVQSAPANKAVEERSCMRMLSQQLVQVATKAGALMGGANRATGLNPTPTLLVWAFT